MRYSVSSCAALCGLALVLLASACSVTETTTVPLVEARPTAVPVVPAIGDRVFAPTVEFLTGSISQTEQAESFEFQAYSQFETPLGVSFGTRGTPVISGVVVGDRTWTTINREPYQGEAALSSTQSDTAFEITTVAEADDIYITSEIFEVIAGIRQTNEPWARNVSSGWGRVDAGSVEYAAIAVSANIGTDFDGKGLLELLGNVDSVLDGGTSEVRGVPTRILHGSVPLDVIVDFTGGIPVELELQNAQLDRMGEVATNIETHIDTDGFVRRIELIADFSSLDGGRRDTDHVAFKRVDYFNFGEDLSVDVPAEWVEVTEELAAFLGN